MTSAPILLLDLDAQALAQAGPYPDPPTTVLIHPGEAGGLHRILIHDSAGRSVARVRAMALELNAILPALNDPAIRTEVHRVVRTDLMNSGAGRTAP